MNNTKIIDKRFFLVGFPRSGTTLVQQIFATDKNIYSCQETHFFSLLNPVNKIKNVLPTFFFQKRALKKLKEILSLDKITFNDYRLSKKSIYKRFFKIMDDKTLNSNCNSWCEKTPRHLHFISEIYKHNKEIEIIFILRNPVPAINSLYKAVKNHTFEWRNNYNHSSIQECANRWVSDFKIMKALIDKNIGFLISYDALVANPIEYADYISRSLGIQIDINQFNNQAEKVINTNEQWKSNNYDSIKPSGDWSNQKEIHEMIDSKVLKSYDELIENMALKL